MKARIIKHRYVALALIIAGLLSSALLTQRSTRGVLAQEGTKITPDIPVIPPGSAYRQTNFVSDTPGYAAILDPLLVNRWTISATTSRPAWIANNVNSTP